MRYAPVVVSEDSSLPLRHPDREGYPFPRLALTPAPPFSWEQTVAALRDFGAVPDRGVEVAAGVQPAWELAVRLEGGRLAAVRIEAAPGEGPEAPDLRLHVTGAPDLTLGETDSIWRQLDHFLALSLDLSPLVAEAANDPAFAEVEAALHGFHPPRFRTIFQAACWTVVRQRTPQGFAVKTMERLAGLLGDTVASSSGRTLPLFPQPGSVAHGARSALLAATNNIRKVERLEGLAAEFARVDEAELLSAGYDDLLRWLRSLPGLGPWSAEQVIWRGCGFVERAPWRDTGALGAVSAVYTPGLTLVRGAARELARHYDPLQAVWMSYLKAYPRVAGAGSPRAAEPALS